MSADANVARSATSFTEDEQHVGGNAFNFFKANQHDAALGILKKLLKTHASDIRLLHNRAVTDFCKSGKTKIADFKKNLAKIQKQLQQSNKEDEDFIACNEKNSYVALYYNQALLYYNLHQYKECEISLERIYDNLDGSDEKFMLKVCLLLIDTYIHTYNSEKAITIISIVERQFLRPEESSKKNVNSEEKSKIIFTLPEADALRTYMSYLKTCCYLQLKSVKSCKKEMKSLSNVLGPAAPGTQTNPLNAASVLLRSNLEFLRGNYHKAYKMLATSPPPSNNAFTNDLSEGLTTMYYNNIALVHFHLAKHNLGTFYMQKAMQENEAASISAAKHHYSNLSTASGRHQQVPAGKPLHILCINRRFELLYNLGIHCLHTGNYTVAFECLLSTVHNFRSNPRLWLRLAECCIQKSTTPSSEWNSKSNSKKNHQNNTAFSHVGNGVHRKMVVNVSSQYLGGKSNNSVSPSLSLEFASVCLSNALTILKMAINCPNEESRHQDCHDGLILVLLCTLECALEHCAMSIPEVSLDLDDGSKSIKPEVDKFRPVVPCLPGAPVSGSQLNHLHASVLANSAFVALHLGNNVMALEHSRTLLSLQKPSGCHRYLAHMYAAEALVSLDRISEAIQHLSTEKISNVSLGSDDNGKKSPVSDESSRTSHNNNGRNQVLARHNGSVSPWHYPADLSCAHGYMILNLANAHCLRSEYDKAQGLLRRANLLVIAKQIPPQALLLAVYLNLLCGGEGISAAIQILRHSTLIMPLQGFPPLNVIRSNNGNSARPMSTSVASSVTPNSGSTGTESSGSSASGSAPRSKSGTPQPSAGGITPDRITKAKGSESKKRNRR